MLIFYIVVTLLNRTHNWIAYLNHRIFWLVVNWLKELLRAWSNWRWCKNLVHEIYPSFYKDELKTYVDTIEEEVSSHLFYYVVDFVWNVDSRPRAMGNSGHQYVIWSVTSPIPGYQPNQSVQSSLFEAMVEETIKLFSCLQLHFYTYISTVCHCLLSSGLYPTILIFREMAVFK